MSHSTIDQSTQSTRLNSALPEQKESMTTTNEERHHRSSFDSMQSVIDALSNPIMIVDRDLIITFLNQASQHLLKKHEAVFATVFP